ncbi:COG1361 S-layer family protein [Candidatus Woesearchaeota archaeon]|nr:COG1361 S-layer family protein [Candidatus Woesearchaeota archaeon]
MKKRGLMLILVFLLSLSFVYAYEYNISGSGYEYPNQDNAYLRFNNLKYEPYPVTPGDYFEAWLKITNIGDEEASNAQFELVEEFPFSNYGTLPKRVDFPELNAGAGVVVKFAVYVNPDAVEKTYNLKIKARTGNGTFPVIHELPIDVRTRGTLIIISSVEPESIIPGKITEVKFTFKNPTDSVIKEITIKPEFAGTPFTPVNSISERRIPSLKPLEETTLSYELIADTSYDTKPYKVPVTIKYNNYNGVLINQSDIIGLLIKPDVDYLLDIEETEVHSRGEVGNVVISISNTGFTDMKFVSLKLLDSDYYDIIGTSRVYLGNLDSDDFETAEFKIKARKSKTIPFNVLINYKDNYNNELSEQKIVNLPVYSSGAAVAYGLTQPKGSFINIIFYIIVILFIYSWYKEWRVQKDIGKGFKIVFKRWLRKIIDFLKPRNLKRNVKQSIKKVKDYIMK